MRLKRLCAPFEDQGMSKRMFKIEELYSHYSFPFLILHLIFFKIASLLCFVINFPHKILFLNFMLGGVHQSKIVAKYYHLVIIECDTLLLRRTGK